MSDHTLSPLIQRKTDQTVNGTIKHKSPNIHKLIQVRMSPKTTIYFRQDKNLDEQIEIWKYNHRNCSF